jgi:tetratricopeptide (TPR) repeat protein
MPKILKPYTIIPPELYVKRDADKQVRNIISDMGRPGYVLVSRQMGKTNLLLNAKRELETANDIFVYLDLSNPFPDAKSCFENIINIAIESYPEKFQEVGKIITERRNELVNTPPHKQHTNELRMLLKALKGGKLIIILDEIDALTKTDYSDQIFSQIRSIYFASRVNYVEFNNLTYLLSGVVEPNEIIKDPKISPFNIGQKIYLNDFSNEEFINFLNISKLNLSKAVVDRIYYWTNGNPRMTWDVCSEVENQIKVNNITPEIIDKIVTELYLITFDRPPIDNIREHVKHDREVRNSIIEIEFKKGKEISSKIKSKLYLAGIINYEDDDIHIKNRIIKQSLSLDWVQSLEEEDKGLLKIAIDHFAKEEYEKAIEYFERFLVDNDFDDEDKSMYFYYLGSGYFKLFNYTKAIECLNKTSFDPDDQPLEYYRVLNLKGTAYYNLNRIDESLDLLRIIIKSGRKDTEYARALINYGITALKSSEKTHQEEAVNIFKGIIDETGINKDKLKDVVVNELKSIAHLNLAKIQVLNSNKEEAISHFRKSIELSTYNNKPSIMLALIGVTNSADEKYRLLDELIELIIAGKTKPIENDPEKPIDFSFNELRELAITTYLNYNNTLFIKLKPYLSFLGDKPLTKHLYDLALFSINTNKDWQTAIVLLNETYNLFKMPEHGIDKETKYNVLKLLAYVSDFKASQSRQIEYLSMFEKERLDVVDYMDMEIFANTIFTLTEKKKYQEALAYVNLINSVKDSVPKSTLINYLVIYHLELNLYAYLDERKKAIIKSEEIISLANDEKINKQKSSLLGENGLEIIKKNAESFLHPKTKNTIPIRVGKTYGRNDFIKVRYKDGTTIETKFKKVEEDIKTGACFILN